MFKADKLNFDIFAANYDYYYGEKSRNIRNCFELIQEKSYRSP